MNLSVDLNADLGEGSGGDAELFELISSANIATGFHAGDSDTMHVAIATAKKHGVAVGAHPSFFDRENFGRKELTIPADEVFDGVAYQLGIFEAIASALDVQPNHVKPHGALYNMACRDDAYARPIVAAAQVFKLPLMALPGSRLRALNIDGCPFIAEGFADRRYLPDGSLVPRAQPNAYVVNVNEAVQQAEWLLREKGVQTLCVHGDNPQAVEFVRALRDALLRQGFTIQAFA